MRPGFLAASLFFGLCSQSAQLFADGKREHDADPVIFGVLAGASGTSLFVGLGGSL